MNKGLLAVALALPLALAGCTGSLFDSELPVPVGYVLAPLPPGQAKADVTQADLSIGRPDFAPGLDTDRIAVLKGRQLDYYRAVRWGGRTVEVVQSMLVNSLQDQKLFRSVTSEQARVAGDYMLDIEVRHFQAEYENSVTPSAHVMFIGRLIRIVDRRLVATVSSEAKVAASEERMTAVAAAFESASHKVVLDIAQQAAVAVTADQPGLRSARGDSDTEVAQ